MNAAPTTCSAAIRRNPLVPAAIPLLAGVAIGVQWPPPIQLILAAAAASLILWAAAEIALGGRHRAIVAPIALALAALCAGIALGQLNQHHVESTHVARFALADDPVPITAHLHIVTVPDSIATHGNLYFVASTSSVLTDQGWIRSAGELRVKWRAGGQNAELHRGDLVEVYGWLTRPQPALNPGAMDTREFLAADRIFAELRIPRDSGLILLASSGQPGGPDLLTQARLFLRGKLLEHTTRSDVESAYSMVALLLGYRDPVIREIGQAFADAGVAHLLAISGTHVLFFTAMVWGLLRFLPLRPKPRDILVALIVLAYVLATPCGPPVVRAAVALLMFLIGRLLARPPSFLNMLAAAAIIVILLRPADLFDAGFQLSFICTAALFLMAPRLYAALFADWIEKKRIIAELAATPMSRLRLRASEILAAMITANLIGAATAIPLVAYHFGRVNPYAVITGLIAIPVVALTMAVSALQLLVELVFPGISVHLAPISTSVAGVMVWIIQHLAALPGAALALRAPPVWLITMLYLPLLFWAARRWIPLRRAAIVNLALAAVALAAAWYTFSSPRGELRVQALSVGQGAAVILQSPGGDTWLINAGSRDAADLVPKAIAPALRVAGVKQVDGLVFTSLNTLAAQSAAAAIEAFRPPIVISSPGEWDHRGQTFAGANAGSAISRLRARQLSLTAGGFINLGESARLRILWPTPESPPAAQSALILLLEYQERRILLMDPASAAALELLHISDIDTRADAVILLAPQRGVSDGPLRHILQATGAQTLIWCGRTPFAPTHEQVGEWNTAAGTVEIRVGASGGIAVSRGKPR